VRLVAKAEHPTGQFSRSETLHADSKLFESLLLHMLIEPGWQKPRAGLRVDSNSRNRIDELVVVPFVGNETQNRTGIANTGDQRWYIVGGPDTFVVGFELFRLLQCQLRSNVWVSLLTNDSASTRSR